MCSPGTVATNYVNVSDQFKDFYRTKLVSLNRALADLQGKPPFDDAVRGKECLTAESGAIERFLGVSPDAGLDQAARLAKSRNRSEREFAAQILGDIGTTQTRESS